MGQQAEKAALTGNPETEKQLPLNKSCTWFIFLAHCFRARLVRRGLFADSLEDLWKGISPDIAVEKTEQSIYDSDPWPCKGVSDEAVEETTPSL